MSQFEQENDVGRGGGEVDEDTLEDAWDAAETDHEPTEQERKGTTTEGV